MNKIKIAMLLVGILSKFAASEEIIDDSAPIELATTSSNLLNVSETSTMSGSSTNFETSTDADVNATQDSTVELTAVESATKPLTTNEITKASEPTTIMPDHESPHATTTLQYSTSAAIENPSTTQTA